MKKESFLMIAGFSLMMMSAVQSRHMIEFMSFEHVSYSLRQESVHPGGIFNVNPFMFQDTARQLMALVNDAAALVREKGEEAFQQFRLPDSRWRWGSTYIFVLDPGGQMLVHVDPELEGKNQLELEDVNGKPIIRGLLDAATTFSDKPEGWFHYEYPVPGELLPRWKSSYVRLVVAPSGKSYIVGSGMYTDRMEREFIVDMVKDAVNQIERNGEASFRLFHDPAGPYLVKDAYVFVIDKNGIDLVNPAFPNLEGRNVMDLKDTQGKLLIREMMDMVKAHGSGWVDYMWPKPGESVSTQKSAYVSKARIGKKWVLVGCGVYLADAPRAIAKERKVKATELMELVREAAAVFEKQGEKAYPEFRQQGTKWYRDDTYFFIWTMDGIRAFHAANPKGEGLHVGGIKDVLGRPWGRMFLETASSPAGEGWVHYMYPKPGDIFPTWKSSYIKRVTFPSGKTYLTGCGIYNMQMDKTFIEDVVNRAADLVAERGQVSFNQLRDKKGPFVFMDTYVFVTDVYGVELVNSGQPSLEGKNLMDLKDIYGKSVTRDYINAALQQGHAWVDYYWYRPGETIPAHKYTYVRKVEYGGQTFIVGAGYYLEDEPSEGGR